MMDVLFYHTLTHFIRSILRALLQPLIALLPMAATTVNAHKIQGKHEGMEKEKRGERGKTPPAPVIVQATVACSSSAPTLPSSLPSLSSNTKTICRPRPIPNSYWATSHLLACEYPYNPIAPSCPLLLSLLKAGVRTFIDLTEPGELVPYSSLLAQCALVAGIDPEEVRYHNFPIKDRTTPPSPSFLSPLMAILKQNESQGRITAVHCRGGIGRTGTVICCWLVESARVQNGREALEVVAREWRGVAKCKRYPNSPETGAQCEFVRNWKGVGGRGVVCA